MLGHEVEEFSPVWFGVGGGEGVSAGERCSGLDGVFRGCGELSNAGKRQKLGRGCVS